MTIRETLDGLFDAWRAGDALRSAAYFGVDAAYSEARGAAAIVGRDEIVAHFTRFFRDGPRFAFHVDRTLVDGEQAAVEYRFSVQRPDGTWHEQPGCAFVRVADGTIAQWREYEG